MPEGKKATETGVGEGGEADRFGVETDRPATLEQIDLLIVAERLRRELKISDHDVRRLIDVQDALTFPMLGPDAGRNAQCAYRNALRDGILAAQSLGELGPAGNARAAADEAELLRRLERAP